MSIKDNPFPLILIGPQDPLLNPLINSFNAINQLVIYCDPKHPESPEINESLKLTCVNLEERIHKSLVKYKRIQGIIIDTGSHSWAPNGYQVPIPIWHERIEENLKQVFLWVKHSGQHMARWKNGKIIIILSISGNSLSLGSLLSTVSDFAIEAFIRSAAKEFGTYQVSVIGLAIGFLDVFQKVPNQMNSTLIPMKRPAKFSEFFETVRFLTDPKQNYLTGQIIKMDGGLTS